MSRLHGALRVASVCVLASIAATAAQPASVAGVEFTRADKFEEIAGIMLEI